MSRSYLASALGYLGQFEEARRIWAELMAINPRYSFAERLSRLPIRNPAQVKWILDGVRNAGLTV